MQLYYIISNPRFIGISINLRVHLICANILVGAKHFGSKSLAIANKLSAEMLGPCKIEMHPNLIPGLQFHNPVLHKSRNAIASSFKSSSNPDKQNPKSQTNRPFNQRIIEYQNYQLIENID